MKACLFNLIIVTEENKQLSYLNETASSIVSKYPARVILIHCNNSIEEIAIDKRLIKPDLYEQVTVHLPQKELLSISLFVLPFLIPDFPSCLFFTGNPVKENPAFHQLIRFCNRLIVDSETSDNLCDFFSTIETQVSKHHLDVLDLNWAKTVGWRQILSTLFDTPERLKDLSHSKEIKIEYQQSLHALNPALYLQAWLASRCHWQLETHRGTEEIRYVHKEGSLKVVLLPTQTKLKDETVTRMTIITRDETNYDIHLSIDGPQAYAHICSKEMCELPSTFYFPNFQKGASYLTQLLYSTTSAQYCETLPLLKKLYA